ncbi:hypothetical protein HOLleu_02760 [Holothuria leucospilota]|uniref:Uncharacterized protein n=1 Tax=Holothuria leucospilota TaxID=206669 RepID=A0A9Q1HLL0_HOLLE|nr:hypothetical protein HOLleu_02760 [Holothuria leucospilota]
MCSDGTCIDQNRYCGGFADCVHGEDEPVNQNCGIYAITPVCMCTHQRGLSGYRHNGRELRSCTSFLAHAELETGVAARKFGHCKEKSRAAARVCILAQPALKRVFLLGSLAGSFAAGKFPCIPCGVLCQYPVRHRVCIYYH